MAEQEFRSKESGEGSQKVELRSAPLGVIGDNGKNGKKSMMIIGGVIVVLIIAVGVLGAMSGWWPKKSSTTNNGLPVSGDQAATSPLANNSTSGLSGVPCAEPNRRPIGVMVAGDPINRPLSGISQADMVFEFPALVSDVTRLTAVYQCGQPKEIGSVRSARHFYMYMLTGIDGIMGHWGGSFWVLNMVAAGEFQTINALQNPFDTFYRKNTLPAPYNGFTSYDRLWNALQKLGYRTQTIFQGYPFKDDADVANRPAEGSLTIAWPGAFRVTWQYDAKTNRYVRYWAGVKQTDPANSNAVVEPSVVAIIRSVNTLMPGPGGYNNMDIEGTGQLDVYQDGMVIHGTWKKDEKNKNDPMHYLDENGKEITFTRGQVWVMAVEPTIDVTWTAADGTKSGGQGTPVTVVPATIPPTIPPVAPATSVAPGAAGY